MAERAGVGICVEAAVHLFTLNATSALKHGANELVVELTNTWDKRLVSDAELQSGQRRTQTKFTVSASKPRRELELGHYGLLGPVRLVAAD